MNDQERFAALRERLSRQMRIKELGEDGEKRILKTRFLVIGAGGLGSPALLYLASSGASHITVVDPDEVSENNLSRQILHDGSSIGLNKAQNAAQELLRWNPVLDVGPFHTEWQMWRNCAHSYENTILSSTAPTIWPLGS